MKANSSGFTLMEILIAVAIVGILSAVAIPSYNNYALKGYRSQALVLIQELAAKQEAYYNMYNRYAWLSQLEAAGLGTEERTNATVISDGAIVVDNRYKLTNKKNNNTFSFQLAAIGDQLKDSDCKFIRIDQDSQTTGPGTAEDKYCFSS